MWSSGYDTIYSGRWNNVSEKSTAWIFRMPYVHVPKCISGDFMFSEEHKTYLFEVSKEQQWNIYSVILRVCIAVTVLAPSQLKVTKILVHVSFDFLTSECNNSKKPDGFSFNFLSETFTKKNFDTMFKLWLKFKKKTQLIPSFIWVPIIISSESTGRLSERKKCLQQNLYAYGKISYFDSNRQYIVL
jgi:hypothetical protein